MFKRYLVLTLVSVVAGSCGYRPAARVLDEGQHSAVVPAFTSYIGYPELDVFAGSYLASRMTALGVTMTADNSEADVTVRGIFLSVTERPLSLQPEQTLVELVVSTKVEVTADHRDPCTTSTAEGSAILAVPMDATSEPARQATLQQAAVDSIDQLLMEVLLCIDRLEDD